MINAPISELTILDRFRKFFAENPREFLTREDARIKFELTERQLNQALRILRLEETVETGNMIWAGPKVNTRKPR